MKVQPSVYIIGRSNVGKSTLFNRLTGKSIALVDDQPGTTRDLRNAEITWNGRIFTLFDTGGWVPGEKDGIASQISRFLDGHAMDAGIFLFLMDAKAGVTTADEILLKHLRKFNVPLVLAVNKADKYEQFDQCAADFFRLGIDPTLPLSAIHGIGIDALLDALTGRLSDQATWEGVDSKHPIRVAVLGKPNVGKSTLVNTLLGHQRVLVDETPGTTHDSVEVAIERESDPIVLVDTAGLRATRKRDTRIEHLSVQQSMNSLRTCQVAWFLLDGEKGVTHQDAAIARTLEEAFRPVLILVNKWDVHPKGMEQAWAGKTVRRRLGVLRHAPLLFLSAKTGLGVEHLLKQSLELWEESRRSIPTGRLNEVLHDAVAEHPPTSKKGHLLKVLYGYQRKGHPPVFEVIANHPESTRLSYVRYLEDAIRSAFGLGRTPLQVVMKLKRRPVDRARQEARPKVTP